MTKNKVGVVQNIYYIVPTEVHFISAWNIDAA